MVKIQELREIMRLELKGIPVDVIHGIQEDAGLVPRIKDYAMHRNVPGVIIVVEVVHMTPPCRNSMVSLPHVKHLARESGKVRIGIKLGRKAVVGGLPKAAPGIIHVARDIKCLCPVVVDGDIQHSIAVTIARDELVLQPLHINLVDGPHKRQGTKPTKGNAESGLGLRLDAQAVNDGVGVTLLPLAKHDLTLVGSETLRHTLILIIGRCSLLPECRARRIRVVSGDVALHVVNTRRHHLTLNLCKNK